MKKLFLSILAMVSMSLAHAKSTEYPGCAVTLDSPVITVDVEKDHVIDVCLQDTKPKIDLVVLGDDANWRVAVGSSRDIVYITTNAASGGTNVLIYLDGEPEVRYEVRLRAVKMLTE